MPGVKLRQFTLATSEELELYRLAPSGEGPHAADWADKPHRLVYDLVTKAVDLADEVAMLRADLERIERMHLAGELRAEWRCPSCGDGLTGPFLCREE